MGVALCDLITRNIRLSERPSLPNVTKSRLRAVVIGYLINPGSLSALASLGVDLATQCGGDVDARE